MRAILIDANTKTIVETEYAGDLDDLYRILDSRHVDAKQIDGDIFESGWHSVWHDDEFLLDESSMPTKFFEIKTERGSTPPIAGKGLIVGHNQDEPAPATLTLDEVRAAVTFTERRFRGFRQLEPTRYNHPIFGEVVQFGVAADLPIVDGANEDKK
jgi:hypothetical protein